MWKLPRLQLVFWPGTIGGVVTLFVATIADDLGDISDLLLLFLSLTTCNYGWNGISSSCRLRPFALSLTALHLFFFLGLLKGLLGLRVLFGRIGLVFGLQGLFIRLIVLRIKTNLQRSFFFGAPLIKMGTSLDLGPSLSLLGYSD